MPSDADLNVKRERSQHIWERWPHFWAPFCGISVTSSCGSNRHILGNNHHIFIGSSRHKNGNNRNTSSLRLAVKGGVSAVRCSVPCVVHPSLSFGKRGHSFCKSFISFMSQLQSVVSLPAFSIICSPSGFALGITHRPRKRGHRFGKPRHRFRKRGHRFGNWCHKHPFFHLIVHEVTTL